MLQQETRIQTKPSTTTMALLLSAMTQDILTVGARNNWNFKVLGKAPLPQSPTRLGDWLVVPAGQDSTVIPVHALERAKALQLAGIRPKGFLLVHEAPLLLSAPEGCQPTPEVEPQRRIDPDQLKEIMEKTGQIVEGGFNVLVKVAGAMLKATAIAIGSALVLTSTLLDPILIAVTDDGYWIEIDRWEV